MCLCISLIPDIRPPARWGCAPPPGLGFAFAPGVRGAKTRMKETRLGKCGRGDSHAEGGGACTRRTKRRTASVRRRAPAELGCHDPATPNAQCTRRDSALTSHVARVVAMDPCPRCAVWGRGAVLFLCGVENRPSLCGVSWWSAGFAQGGAQCRFGVGTGRVAVISHRSHVTCDSL